MKYKKFYHIILLISILLSACASNSGSEAAETPTQTELNITTPVETKSASAEFFSKETAPVDKSLSTAPGSYLLRYDDAVTGDYMDYYLFIPDHATENMPLIIFLHGDKEVGHPELLENYGIMVKIRDYYENDFPFIAILPNTHTPNWTGEKVTKTLKGLLDHVSDQYAIDENRLILTGHSTGAIAVWHMVSTYGDYFAGAVPVSCGTVNKLDYSVCAKVPICGLVGDSGAVEPNYLKAMQIIVDEINAAGGNAKLIVSEGLTHEDTARETFTPEVFEWILSQKKE